MQNHSFFSAAFSSAFFALILFAFNVPAHSQTFTSLFSFNGSNGQAPQGLVQGRDGNLYGTTGVGGSANNGTIFRMTPAGVVTTLHQFTTDGDGPSTLVLGTDGSFYGTTSLGGASSQGAVYKFSASGYSLVTNLFYGQNGVSALVEGPDGNFYGTAEGGANNWGVVFRVSSKKGTHSTLHSFNSSDGLPAPAPLAVGLDGALYGTTVNTVFKIATSGQYTLLHTFSKSTEGNNPGGLTLGTDGLLYGATSIFGISGAGAVFTISTSGTFTIVATIDGSGYDGFNPNALTLGNDGNFYGTMANGGAEGFNEGTVFELAPSGTFTILYNFDGTHGSYPSAAVVQHTSGTFYGSTRSGGQNNAGTIFSENTGLTPFVAFVRSYGMVGSTVQILGQGLTSTSGVSFNGIPASSFHVESDTFLEAVVPGGASTGPLTVTTSEGTLASNVAFHVIP